VTLVAGLSSRRVVAGQVERRQLLHQENLILINAGHLLEGKHAWG